MVFRSKLTSVAITYTPGGTHTHTHIHTHTHTVTHTVTHCHTIDLPGPLNWW